MKRTLSDASDGLIRFSSAAHGSFQNGESSIRTLACALFLCLSIPVALAATGDPPVGLSFRVWGSISQQIERELYAAEPDSAGVLQAYNQTHQLWVSFPCAGVKVAAGNNSGAANSIRSGPIRLRLCDERGGTCRG